MPVLRYDGSLGSTVLQRAARLLECAAGLVLLALAIVVLLQVVSRYILRAPIDWTIDGATMLLIWVSFLGAVTATFTRAHFAMEFVVDALPDRASRVFAIIADSIVIVVLVELVIVGWRFAVLQTDQLYPSAGVPKAWAAAAIPIGALLMIPRYLLDALRRLGLLAGS